MLFPKKKKFQSVQLERKSWLQLSGIRKALFLNPFQSNTSELWQLHFSTKKSKCSSSWSASHNESQNSCFSMPPDHTPVCTPLRPAQNFHGECSHIQPTVLIPHPHIFTCLVTKRQSTRISWQCIAECMFQWLWRTATSTRQEYKLLFTGRRRLLTKMVAILKIIYAFSCSVVKLCEISTSLTCKYSRPGYNGIGLCGTSSITSDILWHQLIPRC